jgi:hypothetical protein
MKEKILWKLFQLFNISKLIELYKIAYGLRDGTYIGEDGDMVCFAKSSEKALKIFKRRWITDVGDDGIPPEMTTEFIGRLYLLKADDEHRKKFGEPDLEWYVSATDWSPVMVYVYRF